MGRADMQYRKGVKLAERKAYQSAVRRFKKAISLDPDHLEAQHHLGMALIQAGEYRQSIKPLDITILLDPDHTHAYLDKGFALLRLGEYREAAEWMDVTLNVMSDVMRQRGTTDDHALARSHFYKGLALFGMGEYGRAVQCYDMSISLEPDKWDVHSNKGDALQALGRTREAKECFDRCMELKPDNSVSRADKARVPPDAKERAGTIDNANSAVRSYHFVSSRNASGDARGGKPATGDVAASCPPPDTIKDLECELEADPGNTVILRCLADALSDARQYRMAAKHYETLTKLNPTDADAYCRRGMMLLKLAEYQQAIQCYRQSIEAEPDYHLAYAGEIYTLCLIKEYDTALERADLLLRKIPEATSYVVKGNVLSDMGEYRQAIDVYDKSILHDPDYNAAYFRKAATLRQIGEHEQAIQCIDAYIQLHPEDPDVHYKKGTELANMERYQKALECFDDAIRLDSDKPEYHEGKGSMLAQAERYREALVSYEKALSLDTYYAGALRGKAHALFSLGEYSRAEECIDKWIELDPSNAIPYCHKCLTLMDQGKFDQAQAAVDRAIQLDPDNDLVQDTKRVLHDKIEILAKLNALKRSMRGLEKIVRGHKKID